MLGKKSLTLIYKEQCRCKTLGEHIMAAAAIKNTGCSTYYQLNLLQLLIATLPKIRCQTELPSDT